MPDPATPKLETHDIQAIILSGFVHLPFSSYLFLHLEEKDRAQEWLAQIIPQITHARWETDAGGRRRKPGAAANIAFTCPGLATLGLSQKSVDSFSQEFSQGMAEPSRSRRLGDMDDSAPAKWEIGGPSAPGQEIHALLIVQAATESALAELRQRHLDLAATYAVHLVGQSQEGYLPGDGREHFGFADGIAEPNLEGSPKPPKDDQACIKAGEFILGYPNEYGNLPSTPQVPAAEDRENNLQPLQHAAEGSHEPEQRDLGRNGSYLVFRKLQQDVAAFRRYLRDTCPDPARRDWMAAKLVGRWPSGTPLALAPHSDPHANDPPLARTNAFCYAEVDPEGLRCPLGAHVRRVNPRDSLGEDPAESLRSVNRHRLLRRGVIYGPKLPPDVEEDDKTPRGVLFFCVNTNIRRQFEFVQQTWINNPKFAGLYDNKDPLLGDNDGHGQIVIQDAPLRQRLAGPPRLVSVRGGGYFFLPGIAALCFLAGVKQADRHREKLPEKPQSARNGEHAQPTAS
jgi:Dyp-type peroxidase family